MVRIDWFESVAIQVAESQWVNEAECRRVQLMAQTRVYHRDPDTGTWRAGRVVGGGPQRYYVRFPNADADVVVAERDLRVRWDRPIANPVDVMLAGANESPFFRDARLPMLQALTAQRAASGSLEALLSSAIEIYPHQVHTAMTVLSDPVQRYLLADEVGLGKTIEAGIVIRQVLLDSPESRIVVVAPDVLRRQWQHELLEKFFIDDFPKAEIKISAHETPDRWRDYHGFDLVVVDETHQLTRVAGPEEAPYRQLCALAHSSRRLLMLSATPFTSNLATTLGLLHLLDPDLYGWDRWEEFHQRFEVRKSLATAVYAIDPEFEPLLRDAIRDVADLLPPDPEFDRLSAGVTALLTESGDLADEKDRPELVARVAALRAHVSETYRLHRRIIRHRRVDVLTHDDNPDIVPFEVTGRDSAEIVALTSDTADDAVLQWQSLVAAWLVDRADEATAEQFGMVLGVLVSRADWRLSDLADALRWRIAHDFAAARRAALTDEERRLLREPPLLPGELDVLAGIQAEDVDGAQSEFMRALARIATAHKRVAVFCGGGSFADTLVPHARSVVGSTVVFAHTAQSTVSACEQEIKEWHARGGVLLADDTAEDGLNLQAADAVVHCRLPWSPNRLEQRIGRVDRYETPLTARRDGAKQYIVLGNKDGLLGAWTELLAAGVRIFDGSVSSLQDALDRRLPSWWAAAVLDGPEGFADVRDQVRDILNQERRHVHAMDMLESVHEAAPSRDTAARIGRLEARWRELGAAIVNYAGQKPGGLRFASRHVDAQGRVVQFERGSSDPLMPPRMFMNATQPLRPDVMGGTFNRTVALRSPGTRLLRAGNPFVDMLTRVVEIDDRGQAAALLRRLPPTASDEQTVFFGFDYLVETDIEAAAQLLRDTEEAKLALRRQADRLYPPLLRRVWVPAGVSHAVEDDRLRQWLDRPYDPATGDLNLNASRIGILLDACGGFGVLSEALRAADDIGCGELVRLAGLARRREQALAEGRRMVAVQHAQVRARQAAGRLVSDAEDLLIDLKVSEALLEGIAEPRVRTVSVTCLVAANPQGARIGPG